jgi:hypothetical protein
MSTPTPRLLKDLAVRDAKENGTKTGNGNGNGNGKPTNGAPKPLVVEKTPKGPRLTRAAAKVAKSGAKKVPLKLTKPATKNGKPKKESKMSKARVIYKAMKNKPRQGILAAFIVQSTNSFLSPASSSTPSFLRESFATAVVWTSIVFCLLH